MAVNGLIESMSCNITLDRLVKNCTAVHINVLQPSHPACVVTNVQFRVTLLISQSDVTHLAY